MDVEGTGADALSFALVMREIALKLDVAKIVVVSRLIVVAPIVRMKDPYKSVFRECCACTFTGPGC